MYVACRDISKRVLWRCTIKPAWRAKKMLGEEFRLGTFNALGAHHPNSTNVVLLRLAYITLATLSSLH